MRAESRGSRSVLWDRQAYRNEPECTVNLIDMINKRGFDSDVLSTAVVLAKTSPGILKEVMCVIPDLLNSILTAASVSSELALFGCDLIESMAGVCLFDDVVSSPYVINFLCMVLGNANEIVSCQTVCEAIGSLVKDRAKVANLISINGCIQLCLEMVDKRSEFGEHQMDVAKIVIGLLDDFNRVEGFQWYGMDRMIQVFVWGLGSEDTELVGVALEGLRTCSRLHQNELSKFMKGKRLLEDDIVNGVMRCDNQEVVEVCLALIKNVTSYEGMEMRDRLIKCGMLEALAVLLDRYKESVYCDVADIVHNIIANESDADRDDDDNEHDSGTISKIWDFVRRLMSHTNDELSFMCRKSLVYLIACVTRHLEDSAKEEILEDLAFVEIMTMAMDVSRDMSREVLVALKELVYWARKRGKNIEAMMGVIRHQVSFEEINELFANGDDDQLFADQLIIDDFRECISIDE